MKETSRAITVYLLLTKTYIKNGCPRQQTFVLQDKESQNLRIPSKSLSYDHLEKLIISDTIRMAIECFELEQETRNDTADLLLLDNGDMILFITTNSDAMPHSLIHNNHKPIWLDNEAPLC